jgi:hypothetical protein
VIERRKLVAPFDMDHVRARAVDLGAHLVEHAAELLDLRLARGVDERRPPFGQRRRHHQVFGAGHGGQVEADLRPLEPAAFRLHIAMHERRARWPASV